jgi:nicotinate-nucleotide adenylyltransferase
MRVAIYGGTFDPVHAGHLQIARRVSQLFAIDEFLFVPALAAPHKVDREVLSPLHRYAMLALATQGDPGLLVSTFEMDRPSRQYTVDTLAHFRAAQPGDDLFFVMGADSWAEITTWREWKLLLTLANVIVVTRPGVEFTVLSVGREVAERMVDLRGLTSEPATLTLDPDRRSIFVTNAVMVDVSATQVRKAARENHNAALDRLVPHEVANYIRKYRLYRNKNE